VHQRKRRAWVATKGSLGSLVLTIVAGRILYLLLFFFARTSINTWSGHIATAFSACIVLHGTCVPRKVCGVRQHVGVSPLNDDKQYLSWGEPKSCSQAFSVAR
jgi:hypothetical protein